MADWMWYMTMGWCAICTYCTWYVNHCARKTQKFQSDMIQGLRAELGREQAYNIELGLENFRLTHADELPKQNLDPRKYKLCKGHVNPDKEWPRK